MLDLFGPVLLVVGLVFLPLGLFSLLLPRRVIALERGFYRRLKGFLERRVDAPILPRRVLRERFEGVFLVGAGLVLVFMGAFSAGADAAAPVTVDMAIRNILHPSTQTAPASRPSEQAADLEILGARYGTCGKWIDLTERVRKQVHDGRLTIRVSPWLAGDPIFGVRKSLQVDYRLGGQVHRNSGCDFEMLRIPPSPEGLDAWQTIRTREQLIALAKACPAEVGFFGKSFATGQTVEYRADQPFCLASIVKLFVLAEVMRQAETGRLDLSEWVTVGSGDEAETMRIDPALDAMIGRSDNEATGALAARVGYEQVNALPGQLGLQGLAAQVLPAPGVLDGVLDKRVFGRRVLDASELLPQHGTARGLVGFFELLAQERVVDARVSRRVLEVLERNPMSVAGRAVPIECMSVGKGGSVGWYRPFRPPYEMIGWAIMIYGPDQRPSMAFCVLCEWFPKGMSEAERPQWLHTLSDCIVNVLTMPR